MFGGINRHAAKASFPRDIGEGKLEDQPGVGGAIGGRNSFRKFDWHTSGEDRQIILPKLLCRLLRP